MKSTDLPRCVPALRIGVVGHAMPVSGGDDASRRAESDAIRRVAGVLMGGIVRAAASAMKQPPGVYEEGDLTVRLLTCLAHGFDTWASDAWWSLRDHRTRGLRGDAIGVGGASGAGKEGEGDIGTLRIAMTAVLPESRSKYVERVKRQSPADADAMARLLGEASKPSETTSVVVFEPATPADEPSRVSNDWQAARFLVHHSDVMIAYWNGQRNGLGAGGGTSCTFRAMQLATRLGIPVLWIPACAGARLPMAEDPDARELRRRVIPVVSLEGDIAEQLRTMTSEDANAAVREAHLAEILNPYHLGPRLASESSRSERCSDPDESDGDEHDAVPHKRAGHVELQSMIRACGAVEASPLESRVIAGIWPSVRDYVKEYADPPADGGAQVPEPASEIWSAHQAFDRRADDLMNIYRGGFITIYLTGPLIVVCASLAYACKSHHLIAFALALTCIELLAIGLILWLNRRTHGRQWHQRSVECRIVGEELRHAHWQWRLGRPLRLAPLPARGRMHSPPAWTRWYHDAFVRGLDPAGPSRSRTFDAKGLRSLASEMDAAWLGDQRNYHRRTAARYNVIGHALHTVIYVAFSLVLAITFVSLVVTAVSGAWDISSHEGAMAVVIVLVLVAAVALPALGAAAHGLIAQGEFERLRRSSLQLVEGLEQIRPRVQSVANSHAPLAELFDELEPAAGEATSLMLEELEEWSTSYRMHQPPL